MINSKEALIEYLEKYPPNWGEKKYLEWTMLDLVFENHLEKIGEIRKDEKYETFDMMEYWGENAPISFSKYPYVSIEIYKLKEFNNLYFKYRELGGHVAEERIRLIRKELIE